MKLRSLVTCFSFHPQVGAQSGQRPGCCCVYMRVWPSDTASHLSMNLACPECLQRTGFLKYAYSLPYIPAHVAVRSTHANKDDEQCADLSWGAYMPLIPCIRGAHSTYARPFSSYVSINTVPLVLNLKKKNNNNLQIVLKCHMKGINARVGSTVPGGFNVHNLPYIISLSYESI